MAEEIISGLSVTDLGATGIVVLVVLMILTGRLIPRKQLDDERTEKDYWRAAHTTSEEARRMQTQQLTDVLEGLSTMQATIRALPLPPPKNHPEETP